MIDDELAWSFGPFEILFELTTNVGDFSSGGNGSREAGPRKAVRRDQSKVSHNNRPTEIRSGLHQGM